MEQKLIKLDYIQDNPYQPRTVDDPEHIKKLAMSIATDGLLQLPQARNHQADGMIQLAFGHSRRKAFEWLRDIFPTSEGLPDRYDGYTCMPVEIVELTDEQMYRFAVTENVQRKDLSPIELAQSMARYRDEFKKTSDQIGELFGMNGSTVRGMIRLLDLPAAVQEKVASGEITQGAARKIVSISRGTDNEQIQEIVQDILDGETPDDAIEMALKNSERATPMWESWRRGEKPLGGPGLWTLNTEPKNFPKKYLPEVKINEVAKLVGGDWNSYHDKGVLENRINHFKMGQSVETMPGYDLVEEFGEIDPWERLNHLINPPACTACPFHAVVDRSHYCMFKQCHTRKVKAWTTDEAQKLSKKLGIAVYDPAADGKVTKPLFEGYDHDGHKKDQKLVDDKDGDLRLQVQRTEYNSHKVTDSLNVRVILVGERAAKAKEKKAEEKSKGEANWEAQQRQWKLERERRQASEKFLEKVGYSMFAVAFNELTNVHVAAALAGATAPRKEEKKAEALKGIRIRLAEKALGNSVGYQNMEKGPVAVAKHLQGLATSWGVKLPADFLDAAQAYEIEPVAAETKKAKK